MLILSNFISLQNECLRKTEGVGVVIVNQGGADFSLSPFPLPQYRSTSSYLLDTSLRPFYLIPNVFQDSHMDPVNYVV